MSFQQPKEQYFEGRDELGEWDRDASVLSWKIKHHCKQPASSKQYPNNNYKKDNDDFNHNLLHIGDFFYKKKQNMMVQIQMEGPFLCDKASIVF